MSSYNHIEKFKNTEPNKQSVSLEEYIIFTDDATKEKYVVFKYQNNLDQQLYAVQFEISQWDEKGELLAKSIVDYKDFIAQEQELFVPNAKLHVLYPCVKVTSNLVYAQFDRVTFDKGTFTGNPYPFGEYIKEVNAEKKEKAKLEAKRLAELKKQNKHYDKLVKEKRKQDLKLAGKKYHLKDEIPSRKQVKKGFLVRDLTKSSNPCFAKVIGVIGALALVVLGCIQTYNFNAAYYASYFADDNFDYAVRNVTSQVSITHYNGSDTYVSIPDEVTVTPNKVIDFTNLLKSIKETPEAVTKKVREIGADSFKNEKNIVSITIKSSDPVIVGENAFYNCTNLQSSDFSNVSACYEYSYAKTSVNMVYSTSIKTVKAHAFEDCSLLSSFTCVNATVEANAFTNDTALKTVSIYSVPSTMTNISQLFGGTIPSSVTSITIAYMNQIPEDFFDGCKKGLVKVTNYNSYSGDYYK